MKYSLAVPFVERIFSLAINGGYTGQITANSFMKREFGKKLIEEYFPRVDLTHVIDTSGAYIPGHGTPTTILFGRNRKSVASKIRVLMGIRGEPATPSPASAGKVWRAIVAQVDIPGSQSEFMSAADPSRELFGKHPWSIGGGGAAELKEQIDEVCNERLGELATSIGITSFTLEDDAFVLPRLAARRHQVLDQHYRGMIAGDEIRDWWQREPEVAIFPYDDSFNSIPEDLQHPAIQYLWPSRICLTNNKMFAGKTKVECGLKWYDFGRLTSDKLRIPHSIAFGEVATHNHFTYCHGNNVFKQTAPVIKLPLVAVEGMYIDLLGLLNSSTGCFWLKQVCFPKGGDTVGKEGARVRKTLWDIYYGFNSSNVMDFPLPNDYPRELAHSIYSVAHKLSEVAPSSIFDTQTASEKEETRSLQARIKAAYQEYERLRCQLIALQEELDWQCYNLYGLLNVELKSKVDLPEVKLGQRAFEIVLARKVAKGEVETTWFERHNSTPITEIPTDWLEEYRQLVEQRIEVIENDRNIALIEQPEYKRRWNTEPWDDQLRRALRNWLLERLESYFDFDGRMNDGRKPTARIDVSLTSIARLTDIARRDAEFMEVAELYRENPTFDVYKLVEELVEAESVPLLPVLRYKPTGLRKRAEWEETWKLQRQEDAIDTRTKLPMDDPRYLIKIAAEELKQEVVGDIPVPPKYTGADFQKSDYWRLRGKLDVPRERWVSFPHCQSEDGTPTMAWAGYNHLQLARAVSSFYVDVLERIGGREDSRLVPLLACLIELLPWLEQWHSEIDPEFNLSMAQYFSGFVEDEARQMGMTLEQIRAWLPPQRSKSRRSR
ncbi:BREX-2 system adenine-specific DNA-methyltransferase PglX [Gloeobacter morelensis MG652769]|uniref:site-specific DNA-methyltransferase (adenine-specific) n=1 Tax=Gloeobacter morelensis MG652769 TaxID=2781736 RepID=A0ABY3PU46_9CYAN|nr:BREX-2 system adenine-specific DNA-methyltransferase PglX [Gloeobacter morelensis MG652769]